MTNTGDGIRIVSIEGENIRKLSTVAVRLDGEPGLFRVTGDNEQGKTTFLDIIAMLFGGKKAVKASTIQKGKDGAWFRAELNNGYSIEKRFTAAEPGGYLTVTTPDDAKPNSPQTLLDGWCGPHSFDPGALLNKRASEIEAIILGLAKDPDLKAKRVKIAAKRDALLDDRRPLNSAKQKAERTKRPDGTRPEPVDITGEMERLDGLQEQERVRGILAYELSEGERKGEATRLAIEQAGAEIKRLQDNIVTLGGELSELRDAAAKVKAERDAIPDPAEEWDAVTAHISEADAINAALEPWKEYDRAQTDMKEARKGSEAITRKIKAMDAEEDALLKAAEIPVPGITFSPDGAMLLDGHSIEVASGMRRHLMAFDMATAANPDVRVALLDEANDLGLKAMDKLGAKAIEKGFQVFACRLGLEGPGEIIVADGKAATP